MDYESIASILGGKAEAEGIEALSVYERNVLLPYWASGIIGNGGFQYFYEGAINAIEVAEAFDALGLSECAEACRQSLAVFPNCQPAPDQQERWKWMDDNEERTQEAWEPLDQIIWDADKELETKVRAYIAAHLSDS